MKSYIEGLLGSKTNLVLKNNFIKLLFKSILVFKVNLAQNSFDPNRNYRKSSLN